MKHCIVGLGGPDSSKPYGHLLHWVYVDSTGKLWNWGASQDLGSAAADGNAVLNHPALTHITCMIRVPTSSVVLKKST